MATKPSTGGASAPPEHAPLLLSQWSPVPANAQVVDTTAPPGVAKGAMVDAQEASERGGSTFHATLNFTKSQFGAGVLAIPHIFARTGWVLGVALYALVATICTITCVALLWVRDASQHRIDSGLPASRVARRTRAQGVNGPAGDVDRGSEPGPRIRTYRDVGEVVFGPWGRRLVTASVVFLQVAFACAFIIVLLDNVAAMTTSISRPMGALILFPVLTALALIRWLRDLWVFSAIGLVVYLVGVIGTTIVDGSHRLGAPHGGASIPAGMDLTDVLLFIGTATYSLEGINTVLPIRQSMNKREDCTWTIIVGMAIYTTVVCVYSAIAHSAGFSHCGIVTECLSPGWPTTTVRIGLCVALVLTHPVTLYVASELLEELLGWGDDAHSSSTADGGADGGDATDSAAVNATTSTSTRSGIIVKRRAMRTVLVAITCVVGWKVPTFSLFSDVVGNLLVSFVGFLLPPALFAAVTWGTWAPAGLRLKLGVLLSIVLFGLVVTSLGTVDSVKALVRALTNSTHAK